MSAAIQQMFQRIARRYDLTNTVLSFGLHHRWRARAIALAGADAQKRVLDLCCGTGDLAFSFADAAAGASSITALDFASAMLALAQQKRERRNQSNVRLVCGDASSLPFVEASFDLVACAFGIRNVDDPLQTLQELHRVISPGGSVIILEFGRPRWPLFAWLYRQYSRFIIPVVGRLLTGEAAAYRYLPETSFRFPDGNDFLELLHRAQFRDGSATPILSGVAFIYRGLV